MSIPRNHLVRRPARRANRGKFRTRSNRSLRSRQRTRRTSVPGTAARDSVGPSGKQEQGGLVQKQGAQSPPPAIYNCLNQPQASQNTQTLSSANPLPEKKGQLVGKVVYGKGGQEVGKVQAEVTPQGCDVTAVLVNIGGFIGVGGKQVEIPMQELKQEGDRLVATSMSAQDIETCSRSPPENERAAFAPFRRHFG